MVNIQNGYILSASADDEQYTRIQSAIDELNVSAPAGYGYMLRADTLTWELVELPFCSEEEASVEDYEDALWRFGV